jgi:hypothetical protein
MSSMLVRLEFDPSHSPNCSYIPIERTIVNSRRRKIRTSLLEVRELRQGFREPRHNLGDRSRMICKLVSSLERLDQMP